MVPAAVCTDVAAALSQPHTEPAVQVKVGPQWAQDGAGRSCVLGVTVTQGPLQVAGRRQGQPLLPGALVSRPLSKCPLFPMGAATLGWQRCLVGWVRWS